MEKEAGGETGERFAKLDAVFVEGRDFDFFGPPDRAVEPGDRETAFEGGTLQGAAEGFFFALIEDHGVQVDPDSLV